MEKIASKILLYSDARGLSIPWVFANDIKEEFIIEGKEYFIELKELCNTPTWQEASMQECYWDVWQTVLDNVVLKNEERAYTVEQDGDVFLVPHHKNIKWVTELEELSDGELHDKYDEFLDDVYDKVKIGAYEYATSMAIKEVDPVAYRCGFSDWLDDVVNNQKELYELNDAYYIEDPSEPEDYWEDPYSHTNGHYEWVIPFDCAKAIDENPIEIEDKEQ